MAVTLDMFEYANNAAARAAYPSSEVEKIATAVQTEGNSYKSLGDAGGVDYWQCAEVNTSKTWRITGVSFWIIDKTGNPSTPIYVRLETQSAGHPSGSLVHANASATVGSPSLGAWNRVNFTPFSLAAGSYFLVLYIAVQPNDNAWNLMQTGGSSLVRGWSSNQGSTWSMYSNGNTFYFRVYGEVLQSYYSTTRVQGSYSLAGIAEQTDALNDTLTRVVTPTVDLSNMSKIGLSIRASRTGSNVKILVRDSGGTWSEYTPNVTVANTFQAKVWSTLAVANVNKNAIDRIQLKVINAGADNTFYLDNMYGEYVIPAAPSGCVASYVATNNAKCVWSDNSPDETGFRIEKDIDGAGFSFWKNVAANVEDSGTYTLGANHRIRFRVRAYNPAGDSGYSTSGYVYTTPSAPTNCAISLGTINVIWVDNSTYETGFKIERKLDEGVWNLVETTAAEAESWADVDQPTGANVKYQYRVRAYIGDLYSAYSTSNILLIQILTELLALKEDETMDINSLFAESLALLESLPVLERALTLDEALALLENLPSLARALTLEEILALKEEETMDVSSLLTENLALKEAITEWGFTLEESLALLEALTELDRSLTLEESLALLENLPLLSRALTLTELLGLLESETMAIQSVLLENLALKEDITELGRSLTLEESLGLLEELHAGYLVLEIRADGTIIFPGLQNAGNAYIYVNGDGKLHRGAAYP